LTNLVNLYPVIYVLIVSNTVLFRMTNKYHINKQGFAKIKYYYKQYNEYILSQKLIRSLVYLHFSVKM